jgi:hypothetical protein
VLGLAYIYIYLLSYCLFGLPLIAQGYALQMLSPYYPDTMGRPRNGPIQVPKVGTSNLNLRFSGSKF